MMNEGPGPLVHPCESCGRLIYEGERYIKTTDGTVYCCLECYTSGTGYTQCARCDALDAKATDGDGRRVKDPICHRHSSTLGRSPAVPVKTKAPKKRAAKTNGKNKRRKR